MRRLVLVLLVLLAPVAAPARDAGLGLAFELPGVTLADSLEAPFAVPFDRRLLVLEAPIFLGSFRLAPAVGWAGGREAVLGGTAFEPHHVNRLSLGASLGLVATPSERLRGWAGPRGGVLLRIVEERGETLVDPFVGVGAGGELFLHERWSVGAELRATWLRVTDGRFGGVRGYELRSISSSPSTSGSFGPSVALEDGWTLGADAVLALRFYPW